MSYTPTTEEVRSYYKQADSSKIAWNREKRAEFDRWLFHVKQDAWDEGYKAGMSDANNSD